MKPDFTFIEYTHDPGLLDGFELMARMTALGFIKTAEHHNGTHTFWNQNNTVIMTKVNSDGWCGVGGLGFTMPTAAIKSHPVGFKFDPDTDTYSTVDPGGHNITLLPSELDVSVYHFNVDYDAAKAHTGCGLQRLSGMVYTSDPGVLLEFYRDLDFRISSVNRSSLVDPQNRLELATLKPHDDRIRALVCDTDDVFLTTTKLMANDVEFQQFDLSDQVFDLGPVNYKVRGYNCLATGNVNSYCIENFAPEALPGMDLIIRSRHKFKQINSEALETYYDRQHLQS